MLPKIVEKLIAELSRLPGIGSKTAQRLAFNILEEDEKLLTDLSDTLSRLSSEVQYCERCGNFSDEDLCQICRSLERTDQQILIVEHPADILSFEQTHYSGKYHVLGGLLNPLKGVGPDKLNFKTLLTRLVDLISEYEQIEIIVAIPTSMEGEATVNLLAKKISQNSSEDKVKLTRLATGLPTNSSIEYLDTATLKDSFFNRRDISV